MCDSNADVKVGNVSTTSGPEGVYPRDIKIGEMTEVIKTRGNFTKTIKCRSQINFNNVYRALIVDGQGANQISRLKVLLTVSLDITIQATFLSRTPVFNAYMSISTSMVVLLSIGFGAYTGSLDSTIIGLIKGAIFSSATRVRTSTYFISGLLTGNSEAEVSKEDPRSGMTLAFFAILCCTLAHYFILYIIGNGFNKVHLKGPILIEVILNALLYYVLFRLFKKTLKFLKFKFI